MTEASGPNQLPVDDILDAEQGLIPRKRTNLCRHLDQGMCEYCSPLPPWDKKYLAENGIKHQSFHAHVKELDQDKNRANGSSYIPPLQMPSFTVKPNCVGGHKPWPAGICSKCQPSAVTLQQQPFRMVDHVEFASSTLVNTFIDSWRSSGAQRVGYLYGRYERYDRVPLGIKAVVEAIYEPPQADMNDGVVLNEWDNEKAVEEAANLCGLTRVGIIFTDLTDAGSGDGSVVCKRHANSYFLSCLEVILAAKLQLKHPNRTKHAVSGVFSLKFVTCVVSGNEKQEIEISSYQVSAAGEALVAADLISGSTHPSMIYVNEKTDKRYVPDIFYKYRNQYNLVVQKNAKPAFPDDYLLVTLTHGFPQDPKPLFVSQNYYAIENRAFLGIQQDSHSLARHLQLDTRRDDSNMAEFMRTLSDFHLVCYLFEMDVLSAKEKQLVAKIVTKHDVNECFELFESPGWKTLLTILRM